MNMEKDVLASDQTEVLNVKKLVELLIKTLKSTMIYPEDNPIPQEQKRKLFQRITQFLHENDQLCLEVINSQLYYKGEFIYQDTKENEGLVYSLHRDGISEITFKKDLTIQELNDLLEVFKVGTGSSSLEDDLVTMLWENDFDHISYKVIEEFIGMENVTSMLDFAFSDFEKMEKRLRVLYSEMDLHAAVESKREEQERMKVQNTFQNVKNFVKDEVIKIDQLLEKDKNYDGIEGVLSVLEEVFAQDKEIFEFNESVKVVEKTMDQLLERGDFKSTYKTIQLIEELGQTYKDKSPQRASRLAESINRAGDSERIKLVSSALNKEKELDLEWAKAYLSSLNWNSIFNILNMLGELKTYPARRMVCEVLADMGKEHFEMVARGLTDHRWYVVRNVVGILGKIGDPKALPYLKDTIKHDEVQVRRETIRALELIGGPEVAQVLLLALNDHSPRIRIKAINLLGKIGEKEILKPLLKIVKDKDFKNKSEEEKKAYLFSLVGIGKDQVVQDLKKIIRKGRWFIREKDLETKILTIKALGLINTPKSQNALKELSQKGKKQLREISRRTLERLDRQFSKEDQTNEN
jgi:HEAT repeat protein